MATNWHLPFRFSVGCYNTHLFGDVMKNLEWLTEVGQWVNVALGGLPDAGLILFADGEPLSTSNSKLEALILEDKRRADAIGSWLANDLARVDVVGLCEVWDRNLAKRLGDLSGRPYHFAPAEDTSTFSPAGSGLMLLSNYRMYHRTAQGEVRDNPAVVRWEHSELLEKHSDKGFLHCFVHAGDGFEDRKIAIYMAHTQATLGTNAHKNRTQKAARIDQLIQMSKHRQEHYERMPAIFMGDLNIERTAKERASHKLDGAEYLEMLDALGGVKDAYRGLHPKNAGWTYRTDNKLVERFSQSEGNTPYNGRYDYVVFDDASAGFAIVPVTARRYFPNYDSPLLLSDDDPTTTIYPTSDHDPLVVEFEVTKSRVRGFVWGVNSDNSKFGTKNERAAVQKILLDWMMSARLAFEYTELSGTSTEDPWIQICWKTPEGATDGDAIAATAFHYEHGAEIQLNPALPWRMYGGDQTTPPTRHTYEAFVAHCVGHAIRVPYALGAGDHLSDKTALMRPFDDPMRMSYVLSVPDRRAAEAVYGKRDPMDIFDPLWTQPDLDFASLNELMKDALDELGDFVVWQKTLEDQLRDKGEGIVNRATLKMRLVEVRFADDEDTWVDFLSRGTNEFKIHWSQARLGHYPAPPCIDASGSNASKPTTKKRVGVGKTWTVDIRPSVLVGGIKDLEYALKVWCVGIDKPSVGDNHDKLGSTTISGRHGKWTRDHRIHNIAATYKAIVKSWKIPSWNSKTWEKTLEQYAKDPGRDFYERFTAKMVNKGRWTADLEIELHIPADYSGHYVVEASYKAEAAKRQLAWSKQVRARAAELTRTLAATVRATDRSKPREGRALITKAVRELLIDAVTDKKSGMSLRPAGDGGSGSMKPGTGAGDVLRGKHAGVETLIRTTLFPAAGKRERKAFFRQVALHLDDLGQQILVGEELRNAAPELRRRMRHRLVEGKEEVGARALMARQWKGLREDLFAGIPAVVLIERLAAAVKAPDADVVDAAYKQVDAVVNQAFPSPKAKALPSKTKPEPLTIAMIGAGWDLAHETLARADVKLVHGVVQPNAEWTPSDTAALSVLAGSRVAYKPRKGRNQYRVGVEGALPHARFRLFSTAGAEGAEDAGLAAAIEAAIAACERGSILVVPRTLRRDDVVVGGKAARSVQLPLDADEPYAALLRRAVNAGLLVLISAGRSKLDLDRMARTMPALGTSGAKIVAADVKDSNRGKVVAARMPNRPMVAAGFDRTSVRRGAPYTDRWTGQIQAVVAAAILVGAPATAKARRSAWNRLTDAVTDE